MPAESGPRGGASHYELLLIKTVIASLRLLFQRLRQEFVRAAGLGYPRWMVMGQDHRCGIAGECNLHYLAGIHARLCERAAKNFDVFDQAILRVEEECDENLVLALGELRSQIVTHDVRRRHRSAPT